MHRVDTSRSVVMVCLYFPIAIVGVGDFTTALRGKTMYINLPPDNYSIVDGRFDDDEDNNDHSSSRSGYLNENQQYIPTA
jgi:hypothetical protein